MAKIEWVFQDESGTNLNRYIATNVNTGEKITFDLLRGGNVSIVGTPLNASNLNSLITAINNNYDEIATLKTSVSTNSSKIALLETDNTNNKNTISALGRGLTNVETRISTNATNIQTNIGDISQLKTTVSTNKNTISKQGVAINTNTTNISNVSDRVNELEEEIQVANDSINANSGEISNLNDRVVTLENNTNNKLTVLYQSDSATHDITLTNKNNSIQPNTKYYIEIYDFLREQKIGGIFYIQPIEKYSRYQTTYCNLVFNNNLIEYGSGNNDAILLTLKIVNDYAINGNPYIVGTEIELFFFDIVENKDYSSSMKNVGISRILKI